MTAQLPTGTVTLVLGDIENSTDLWEHQPEVMAETIARLNDTLSVLIAERGGARPPDHQGAGDSFLAAFSRASDAVAAALELQRSDLGPIALRVGIHTGEVLIWDNENYAGPTCNKTARLRDLAHGGQTILSGATAEIVEERLPAGAWLAELGSHTLRGVSRPVRISQLCHPRLRNEFPPLHAVTPVVAQHLPPQLTKFVGRTEPIDELTELLTSNRLITLVGSGGAGKTRLAIEVASRMGDHCPDGIWWSDLAPINDPDLVPMTIARALGLPDQPGRSVTETLQRTVRDKRVMIVIDNCEHLLDACATLIADLLAACPHITIFATSREPVMIGGELSWPVPSLSLDDEAIELFADRALLARPGFAVTAANVDTVTEICRHLDGIPLAIELAAARMRSLTLEEIADSLHDRFHLLTGGTRTATRRQQTLRASVDWSYTLLSEPERILLRRLAVFMGGFDLAAAENVAGVDPAERYQVLDQLSLLVDKSLVIAESADGRTRYRMLETVRQYAMEKLDDSGETDALRACHRDHYWTIAWQLDAPAVDGRSLRVARAMVEMDNLRAAFTWSIENDDQHLALEFAAFLQAVWIGQGRSREGMRWINTALAKAGGTESDMTSAYARVLADKAVLDSISGSLDAPAIDDVELALTHARASGDQALTIRALTARGCVAVYTIGGGETYFAEAAALAHNLGDTVRLAYILERRAYVAMIIDGRPVDARQFAAEARKHAQRAGEHLIAHQSGALLAGALVQSAKLFEGIAQSRAVAAECPGADNLQSTLVALQAEAIGLALQGNGTHAQSTIAEAIVRAADVGEFFEDACYAIAALAHLSAGDIDAAWQSAGRALPTTTRRYNSANCNWVVWAAIAADELDTARRIADVAVANGRGFWRAMAFTSRSRAEIACQEYRAAEDDAHQALSLAQANTTHLPVPDALECLAQTACEAGSHRESARLLGAAAGVRKTIGTVRLAMFDAGHDATVNNTRNTLGEDVFDSCWTEGTTLSITEAIAYAQRGRGERKRPSSGWESLTPTEIDVVRLVADGIPNKDIATRLFISPRTVQSHLRHVYAKLSVSSRVQLAQLAVGQLAK